MLKAITHKVGNLQNSSDHTCRCGSWLDHWKEFSKAYLPQVCPVRGCNEPPAVGAHVQRQDAIDFAWYIIPLCHGCNNRRGETLELKSLTTVVSANVAETCGR